MYVEGATEKYYSFFLAPFPLSLSLMQLSPRCAVGVCGSGIRYFSLLFLPFSLFSSIHFYHGAHPPVAPPFFFPFSASSDSFVSAFFFFQKKKSDILPRLRFPPDERTRKEIGKKGRGITEQRSTVIVSFLFFFEIV